MDNKEFEELYNLAWNMNQEKLTIGELLEQINKNNEWDKYSVLKNIKETYSKNSKSTLNKKLNKYGFYLDEKQGLWYREDNNKQKEILRLMTGIDVEATIDNIAGKRYYNSFKNGFYYDDKTEMVDIQMNKNLYLEYVELSKKYGCELEDEFMTLVLLEYLDKKESKDHSKEFALRNLMEEVGEEEYQFVIKYMELGYDWEQLIYYSYEAEDLTIEGFLEEMEERQKVKEEIKKEMEEELI